MAVAQIASFFPPVIGVARLDVDLPFDWISGVTSATGHANARRMRPNPQDI